jgi:hypothetical protein
MRRNRWLAFYTTEESGHLIKLITQLIRVTVIDASYLHLISIQKKQ